LQIGLSDFLQITELPIYVDADNARADGWFQKESNRFSLVTQDDGRLRVQLGNKTFHVEQTDYNNDGDLYVELNEVTRWFELDYSLNEAQLTIEFTGKSKLPVELRLTRLGNPKKIVSGSNPSIMPLQ